MTDTANSSDAGRVLVLGIDGGQTSVKCALADERGAVLGEGSGGGLIHLAALGSRDRFVAHVGQAVRAAFDAAGISFGPVAAIGMGLTGVEAGSHEAEIVRELTPQIVDARHLDVQNDGMAALMGAHLGRQGIIAIAGTGSIVLGMNDAGDFARVGGWGWLVGDEGSAMAIGRNGLRAALHFEDGSGPRTALHGLFLQHFGIPGYAHVKRLVYASDFGARGFAALAGVVSAAAEAGDGVAQGVVRDEAVALASQVVAVGRRLRIPAAEVRVAPVSGAFHHVHGLRAEFVHALAIMIPDGQVVHPALPAVQGALILARRMLDKGRSA